MTNIVAVIQKYGLMVFQFPVTFSTPSKLQGKWAIASLPEDDLYWDSFEGTVSEGEIEASFALWGVGDTIQEAFNEAAPKLGVQPCFVK